VSFLSVPLRRCAPGFLFDKYHSQGLNLGNRKDEDGLPFAWDAPQGLDSTAAKIFRYNEIGIFDASPI
jgi:hypothetical protein